MKKYLFFLITSALMLLSSSCDKSNYEEPDNFTWEVIPINLYIHATDGTNNLLDPNYEGNIIEKVSVTYNGTSYSYKPQTKANILIPYINDLFIIEYKQTVDGKEDYYLMFGTFRGNMKFENTPIIISWPDGTKDTITLTRFVEYKNNRPELKEEILLNGEPIEYLVIYKEFK